MTPPGGRPSTVSWQATCAVREVVGARGRIASTLACDRRSERGGPPVLERAFFATDAGLWHLAGAFARDELTAHEPTGEAMVPRPPRSYERVQREVEGTVTHRLDPSGDAWCHLHASDIGDSGKLVTCFADGGIVSIDASLGGATMYDYRIRRAGAATER